MPKENQNNILNNTNEIERYQKLFENKMNQHIYFNSDPKKLTLNATITNNCSTCSGQRIIHFVYLNQF